MPRHKFFILLLTVVLSAPIGAATQVARDEPGPVSELQLGQAAVCEIVREGEVVNEAVAFSATLDRVYCYTDFVSVPEKTLTYHVWYQADQQRTSVKLALRPPRWAVYSYITLREKDKGPWRVEITDEGGTVLRTLHFSVIE